MNIKKEVFEKLTASVEKELAIINSKINANTRIINHAAFENRIYKRERVEIIKLINEWKKI